MLILPENLTCHLMTLLDLVKAKKTDNGVATAIHGGFSPE
jgi:hypothetical protein